MLSADPHDALAVFGAVDTGLIVLDAEARVRGWNAWMAAAGWTKSFRR